MNSSDYMSKPEHDYRVNASIAMRMMEEYRFVDAGAFMWCLEKLCRSCWLLTCSELLANPPQNVNVSSIYTLREATSNNELSLLNVHYPGVTARMKSLEIEKVSNIAEFKEKCRTFVQEVRGEMAA